MAHTLSNGTMYTTINTKILGNNWNITVANGKIKYINICKVSNNPYRILGKDFRTFDDAARAYKSPEMKTAILMAEIEFNAIHQQIN